MMLTMMMNTPASAGNLSYNYSGADGGNFGKPTSTEPVTVVDGDAVNVDISKNSAFIPPLFGSPEADVLGMGELLTPDISGVEPMFPHSTQAGFAPGVTENGAETGGGPIVLPPDAAGSEVSGAPIYDSTPSGNMGLYRRLYWRRCGCSHRVGLHPGGWDALQGWQHRYAVHPVYRCKPQGV